MVQKYIRILKRPNKNAFFRDKFLERAARQAFPDGAEWLEDGLGAASGWHRAFGAADGAQAVLGRGGAHPSCGNFFGLREKVAKKVSIFIFFR